MSRKGERKGGGGCWRSVGGGRGEAVEEGERESVVVDSRREEEVATRAGVKRWSPRAPESEKE